jgi:protein-L-isoaspartate(D-aspartate) O-methyltransferase
MGRVEEAMAVFPRDQFLRPGQRHEASYDGPLPIGSGQTNSQPSTVAEMLRLLDVQTGQRVLDVGSGSGWTTALLAHLVGPDGQVHGVEIEPSLVRFGSDNLEGTHQPWARIQSASPDTLGLPDQAPFDRILVSASPREMPDQLVDQLAPDGVMVIPVAGVMLRVTNPGAVVTQHGPYRFVPLR